MQPESAATERAAPLALYLEVQARVVAQRLGDGGPDVCHALSEAMDGCLARLAAPLTEGPLIEGRFAVVAVGGYGRRELCLYSDIDIMLLHAGDLPRNAVASILYPLWDAKLKVGHAVRTIRESLAAAGGALATLTALLDARTVAGDAALVADLLDGLGTRLRRGRLSLAPTLAQAEQRRRAAEPFQLLDADVKDGRGGLRSLQALHWERRRHELIAGSGPLPVPTEERAAGATLLATRNALHSVAGRAFDRYVFELRQPAAAWLGLDVMVAGHQLYGALRTVDALAAERWSLPEPDGQAPRPDGQRSRWTRLFEGRPRGGRAASDDGAGRPRSVSPLVIAARALDRGASGLTPEEQDVVRTGGSVEWAAEDRAAFLRLLAAGRRGWTMFRALEALGWVGRVLPEWRHVVAAPQEAPFHLHPVDVHLWRTVIELVQIAGPDGDEPWCREVAAELGSLDEALLAALLHDIGKGWPGDHSTTGAVAAAALLRRARFGPATTATVGAAVRQHLLLPNTAMRRDIDDPRVAGQVAARAGDRRTLRILFLLSVADARATGPSVWNDWKASLLRSLFAHAARELERRTGGAAPPPPDEETIAAVAAAGAGRFDRGLIAEQLRAMPAGYASAFDAAELLRHLELMLSPPSGDAVAVDVRPGAAAVAAAVVAEDRPGLLATISGVFALHNISVLDGRFYTRADGIVLDIFHVEDALGSTIPEQRWARVRADLPRALRGELELEALLREKAAAYRRPQPAGGVDVVVDTDASERFGVVEVHCADRIGLLHAIARGLFDLGLDIRMAKVDTRGAEVVDTFYVRGAGDESAPARPRLLEAAGRLRKRLQSTA